MCTRVRLQHCHYAPRNNLACNHGTNYAMKCGYGLQLRRYATPSIVAQAASKGIELVPIGISAADRPLRDQGPFHAILHKLLPDDPFYDELESYCTANPHVRVLDEFKHVNSIRNREGMLHALKEGIITHNPRSSEKTSIRGDNASESSAFNSHGAPQVPATCTYSAPKQVTVPRGCSLDNIRERLTTAGIVFPIMSKPLQADGSDGSHCISLFLTQQALEVRALDACSATRFCRPTHPFLRNPSRVRRLYLRMVAHAPRILHSTGKGFAMCRHSSTPRLGTPPNTSFCSSSRSTTVSCTSATSSEISPKSTSGPPCMCPQT